MPPGLFGMDEDEESLGPASEVRNCMPILQIRMPPASWTTGKEMPKSLKIQLPASVVHTHMKKQYTAMRFDAAFLVLLSSPVRSGSTIRAVPIGLTGGN